MPSVESALQGDVWVYTPFTFSGAIFGYDSLEALLSGGLPSSPTTSSAGEPRDPDSRCNGRARASRWSRSRCRLSRAINKAGPCGARLGDQRAIAIAMLDYGELPAALDADTR